MPRLTLMAAMQAAEILALGSIGVIVLFAGWLWGTVMGLRFRVRRLETSVAVHREVLNVIAREVEDHSTEGDMGPLDGALKGHVIGRDDAWRKGGSN